MPEMAVSEVQATTSQVPSGNVLPQEKVKLAHKLLGVSSRISPVLVSLDRVVDTDPLVFTFWQEVWSRGVASPQTVES